LAQAPHSYKSNIHSRLRVRKPGGGLYWACFVKICPCLFDVYSSSKKRAATDKNTFFSTLCEHLYNNSIYPKGKADFDIFRAFCPPGSVECSSLKPQTPGKNWVPILCQKWIIIQRDMCH